MTELTIEQVDVDGAIREGAATIEGDPRASFISRAALGAAGLMSGGAALAALTGAASAQVSANDASILNFALMLEYPERDFYRQALTQGGAGKGEQRRFTETVAAHETAHAAALVKVLGSSAILAPTFDFYATVVDPAKFRATSITVEDTGVKAYKGQVPLLQSPVILAAALSIHSAEADHAAWIRRISGADPTYTGAFETPLTKDQVLANAMATGFIVS
ncbi:MAG: ferritin-like domain-containing protein [Solirubrobacterales bacterium]|nr:ferritin-like domain-containing protein [Solirubrobacterales bacterium]